MQTATTQTLKVNFDSQAVAFPVEIVRIRPAGDALESLQQTLLAAHLKEVADPMQAVWLRRAAAEATALAFSQPFPTLFLPELLAEKVSAARQYLSRQEQVRQKSPDLLQLAA